MNRTLKLYGAGISETQSNVTIKIDGATLYQGLVDTDTRPFSTSQNWQGEKPVPYNANKYLVESWQEDITFTGIRSVEITANSGGFMYMKTFANHTPVSYKNTPDQVFSSGEIGFISCYELRETGEVYRDPLTNVKLDGVVQPRSPVPTEILKWVGWYHYVPQGSVLTFDLNITQGLASPIYTDGNVVLASASYTGDGATTSFAQASYTGTKTTGPRIYINDVEWGPDHTVSPEGVVTLITPPPAGSTVRIDTVEIWDQTLASYYGFEYQ